MEVTSRRRRTAALTALAVIVVVALALVVRTMFAGGATHDTSRAAAQAPAPPPPPPQLPRGGFKILPHFRVVAYYGAPQDAELGTLGIGTPDQAARRLQHTARRYRPLGRPVLPALELLADVADHDPGDDGKYRTRQTNAVIGRYLKAARKAKAELILDLQPGRADFFTETVRLRRWLEQPDVSLALDPEWHVAAPGLPGQVIGSVDAREINAVSYWLELVTKRHRLPQKLLLIHRFTDGMIAHDERLKTRPHLAVAINVDGFGGREIKTAKYESFARRTHRLFDGFKLFFKEDTNMMQPRDVGRLRPRPDVVVYE
jgi:hypothetical protein